jgi:glycosyltransferase involved in cell wall biosynthesis
MPYLPERLESILGQTYPHWKLNVLDSFSDDGSKEVYDSLEDERINVSYVPKEGIYPAWNKLLGLVKHDWVYIATADDTMYPECLEKCLKAISENPPTPLVLFGIDVITEKGRKCEYWHGSRNRGARHTWGTALDSEGLLSGKKEFLAQVFACGAYQSITGMLFSRKAFHEVGAFPVGFGSAGDTYWIMELMSRFDFLWIPEPLATWRLHDQQGSRQRSVDHKDKPSQREQAVDAALQNAIDHDFLSEAQRKLLIELRRESSLRKKPFPGICEKVYNRLLHTNLTAKKRSQWVQQIMEIDEGRLR